MKGVFAAVAGDAEFRQTENAHAGLPGVGDRAANARSIAVPIEGRLVEHRCADADELHGRITEDLIHHTTWVSGGLVSGEEPASFHVIRSWRFLPTSTASCRPSASQPSS